MKSLARWSASNPVAANVFMVLILIGGVMAARGMRRELLPEFDLEVITVSVPYPGASPEEVEEGISIKIEEQLDGVTGIKRITSTSSENMGTVSAELETSADPQNVYNDIKNQVDQIVSFPVEAEEPILTLLTMKFPAVFVAVYGDASERVLRALGDSLREEMLATTKVTEIDLLGARDYEISIEVSEEDLQRYALTFDDVARAVRTESLDLPAGVMRTGQGEILVRAKGQRYRGREYEKIPLVTLPSGAIVRLGDVATVVDGFEDVDLVTRYEGQPATILQVRKTAAQDMIEIVDAVREYVERKAPEMPPGIGLDCYMDQSILVRDRINLLVRNGLQGLVLVLLSLWLFLRLRLAIWVAVGIPISFMGAFMILSLLGASVNMLSLFAFIMTLGIVVDDAIIVGENIYAAFRRHRLSPLESAVEGAGEVGWPVTVSVVTTMVAFAPMLFVEGIWGKFFFIIPMVVIATLAVSLLEAFLILPSHICHSIRKEAHGGESFEYGWRHTMTEFLIERLYAPVLRRAIRWRYLTVAIAFASVIVSVGMFTGGRLKFVLFPKTDTDYINASVLFPAGTPAATTAEAVRRLEDGLRRVAEDVAPRLPEGRNLVENVTSFVGSVVPMRGEEEAVYGSHAGQVIVEIIPTQYRQGNGRIPATEIINRWREASGELPGADRVVFSGAQGGPGGSSIEVRLLGSDLDVLDQASEALKTRLADYRGVYDIRDDFMPGKREIKVRARPEARTLGLTLSDIARQVRQGFYGDETLRIQRGRDEIKVMVRYPWEDRRSQQTLENMRIRTLTGAEIPIDRVAHLDVGRGYSTIRRTKRQRSVTVTADVDEASANADEIVQELGGDFFPAAEAQFHGVRFDLEGQARERMESLGSLRKGFLFAMIAIFCLLAAEFRSYVQPLIIMTAFPVSLTGVVAGHMLVGMPVTLISVFGIVALAGIVINDSLVLIDFINRRFLEKGNLQRAVLYGGRARFRAILLTSMTTVAGLLPILAEKSMQAEFLKPMAVSLAFGLTATTLLTLVVTPSLYLIVADVKRLLGMHEVRPGPDHESQGGVRMEVHS